MAVRYAAGVMPESKSRSHWESESSSEVRTFVESSAGTNREVQELAIDAHRNSPRRSSRSLRACQESVGASLRVHRIFVGSSLEARRKSD